MILTKRAATALSTILLSGTLYACQSPPVDEEEATASSEIESAFSATIFGTQGAGLRVRSEPNTTSSQQATVWDGQSVTILCQTRGEWVDGTDIWDKIQSPAGYVNDAYVRTGYDSFHPDIARCDGSTNASPPAPSSGGASSRGFNSIWGGGAATITQGFAASSSLPYYAYGTAYGLDGTQHPGVDVAMAVGTKLYTPAGGKVACVGGSGSSPDGSSCGFFGDVNGGIGRIQISLDSGAQLILGHCSTATVSPGQRVEAGAMVGTSGTFNGPHVHVEMRARSGGGWKVVDPQTNL